eukprot:5032102-Amphidinium_carterae.1
MSTDLLLHCDPLVVVVVAMSDWLQPWTRSSGRCHDREAVDCGACEGAFILGCCIVDGIVDP